MSQPTTYEQLIARKLEELVVPDHADAIWATIEHQLTIEMPTGGGSGGSGGFKFPSWWIGGKGFLTIIVASFMYVAISKKLFINNKAEKNRPAIINNQPKSKELDDALVEPEPPVILQGSKKPDFPSTQEAGVVQDQVSIQIDTMTLPAKTEAAPVVQEAPADTVSQTRKPKGVQGITDEDYSIESQNKSKED